MVAEGQVVKACAGFAEDSLEHYARCPIIRNFAWQSCRVQYDFEAFFLAGDGAPWKGTEAEDGAPWT